MNSLTAKPLHPQLAQYLDSYVRIYGHEPSSDEIAAFEAKYSIPARFSPFSAQTDAAARAPVAAASSSERRT